MPWFYGDKKVCIIIKQLLIINMQTKKDFLLDKNFSNSRITATT